MKKIVEHQELMVMLLESVSKLMDDIKTRNNELKEMNDYDELTQLHNTIRIIQKWFFLNGNLPV